MSDTPCPCEVCVPWDACSDCCPDWDDFSEDIRCRATSLAWSTLNLLTAGRVGACPVVMRPCVSGPCSVCSATWMNPVIRDGNWINRVCGGVGCACTPLGEIVFPGPVASIVAVTIDGEELDAWNYQLYDGHRLVRTDAGTWPSCQHLGRVAGAVGTFTVEYVPGIDPGPDGTWAAGVLACEYAKACKGSKCRLPTKATSVARNGVTIELQNGLFANGLTGIETVDAFILRVNPRKLKTPAMVWSPDLPQHRFG